MKYIYTLLIAITMSFNAMAQAPVWAFGKIQVSIWSEGTRGFFVIVNGDRNKNPANCEFTGLYQLVDGSFNSDWMRGLALSATSSKLITSVRIKHDDCSDDGYPIAIAIGG